MRRAQVFMIIFLLTVLSDALYGKSVNPYIKLTIESINRGDFETASERLLMVKDWNEDKDEVNTNLNIERGLDFLMFIDTTGRPKVECINYARFLKNKAYDTSIKNIEYDNLLYAKQCAEIECEATKFAYGEQHEKYFTALLHLGHICYYLGDEYKSEAHKDYMLFFKEADSFYQNALKISPTYYNNEAQKIYRFNKSYAYIWLGELYIAMDDIEKAENYFIQALDSCESHFKTKKSTIYAYYLITLGNFYRSTERFEDAKKCYNDALNIINIVANKQSEQYVQCLDALCALYYAWGKYSLAKDNVEKALDIRKNLYGTHHPDYAESLNSYGQVFLLRGDYISAEKQFKEANTILKEEYIRTLNYKTEKQRYAYWVSINKGFVSTYPRFCYKYTKNAPQLSKLAYDNELFTKGVLLESTNAIKYSIEDSGDDELIGNWTRLKELKQQIIHLQDTDPHNANIKTYEQQAEALEKEITRSSAAYRENLKLWEISWEDVRNALKKNEVAIEFMSAPLNQDSTMYCALLLRSYSKQPELIPLFNQQEVAGYIDLSTPSAIDKTLTTNGILLSNYIWSGLNKYIRQGETVYFAPTGILHQLPIEALPYKGEKTLSEIYQMVRLSSTRELVKEQTVPTITNAVLYGDIAYESSPDMMKNVSHEYRPEIARSNIRKVRGLRDSEFDDLKGTKQEIEQINSLLGKDLSYVKIFSRDTANEESFKALDGKHQQIIHVATHGFYWSDSTAKKEMYFVQRGLSIGDEYIEVPSIDPLERCGLAFAGANVAMRGESNKLENIEDGIATAKEISTMDLRGAEIVVLSACETGMGDISGEGVFGLQRGFKMAGAKTLIVSLWKVDDAATQMLMTEFYYNWIDQKQDKRKAFINAQNAVRNHYKQPCAWAAFVMID